MAPTVAIDVRVLGTGRTTGIEEYTRCLLERLVKLGDGIAFKLFSAGRRPPMRTAWMDAPGVTLIHAEISNRLLWAGARFAGRPALDRLVGGADAFFFPHFLLGATSPGVRRIMTWHDLSYERMPELFSVRQRIWHRFQMRPRQQALSADRIIAVSESTRADLVRRYGVPEERVTTVHSGIHAGMRRPPEGDIERFRARWNLPRRFILALGTREPRKNLEGLVAAFDRLAGRRQFADVHLVSVGPDGWLWTRTASRIAESPFRTRIRLMPAVTPDDRALLLSAASVLAYPSLLEGFGFPPLEAMACGTPVVAGATSALWETVGDAGLLVDPYSPDRIAHALAALLDGGPLRDTLVARGFVQAAGFTWERAARRTMDVIRSVL